MKNKYPKEFQLGGVTWSIIKDNKSLDEGECYGDSNYSESLIRYQALSNNKPRTQGAIMTTLYHEIVHAILAHMGEWDLHKNEKFINTFSTLLYQAIKTLK